CGEKEYNDLRISETSSCACFYLENENILNFQNLSIKIPTSYNPQGINFLSREEFIKQFVTIYLWSDNGIESIEEEVIFNQMLSTFRFLE
ncbi:unnamed protein product, partial [marine sediment metagenome]